LKKRIYKRVKTDKNQRLVFKFSEKIKWKTQLKKIAQPVIKLSEEDQIKSFVMTIAEMLITIKLNLPQII
jgi:hypothetical protein